MSSRVTFICGGELVPASRFRVHPVAEALQVDGWDTQIIHGYGSYDQKISLPLARRAYRAACRARRALRTAFLNTKGPIMVQRLALPWLGSPEVRLAQHNSGLVFDFDDAVFLGANGKENLFRRKALDSVFANAAHVVTGNTWLAQAVTANVPVTVIPTCIDTDRYRPRESNERNELVRIGWIGTSGNFPYLHQLVEPLAKLRSSGFSFELVICSDNKDLNLFRALGAKFEKWSAEGELRFLQSIDIGLMPLADDDWCRGKCSFKMIQYMAVGCPVVASAIGMNIDVLRNDVEGKLVTGTDWVNPLAELLESPEHRDLMGNTARKRAVDYYDTRVAVESYRRIFERLQ
jgi:glycosyltransferase involved in cell wall biosynthesis